MKFPSSFGAAFAVLCSFALFGAVQRASAHGVQVGYGTTPTGFVRIYIKHWHGNLTMANLGSSDNINVTVTTATGSNTFNVNASGVVNNTPVANLPGLTGPLTILVTGPSSSSYDDWGYWDFAPGSCNQPISIRINQGNSAIFQEETDAIYPQTITGQTFTDQAGPVITAPDLNVAGGCSGTNVNFTASVVDDCDANPIVTFSKASGSFFPVGTTPVTVTATDNTGKTTVKVFNVVVFVNDTTPPSLTVPTSFTVTTAAGQCGTNLTFATAAVDNCSTATVVSSPASGSFFAKGINTVTTTATDGSGNVTTKTFTITVVDNQNPTITMPGDIVANTSAGTCRAIVTFAATFADNCPGASVSYSHAPGSFFGKGVTVVTATVTDASGRTASGTFNVTVVDVQAPTITDAAVSQIINCGAGNAATLSAWLAANGGAIATDACGPVTWSNNFSALSNGCGATGSATVVFTATDLSGNSATTTATFAIVDTTAPTLLTPASSIALECNGAATATAISTWLASNGGASATDSCSAVTWSNNYSAPAGGCGSTGATTVVFLATDACGNVTSTSATITVTDTIAPVVSAATNSSVQSDGSGNLAALAAWLASNGGASATDACSAVTWSNNFTAVSDGCGATGTVNVIFTAKDACGNASTSSASFTIVDTTAPTVVAGVSSTVESDGAGNLAALNAWLASNAGASASDAGGSVTWTNNFAAVSDGCGATGTASVTFTATDACGNSASTVASFTIVDTTKPTIVTAASSSTVESDGSGNLAALNAWLANKGGATATDVGSSVTWSNNFAAVSDGCGATGTASVTFTATDACGNASSTVASFTIVDTVKPVVVTASSNKQVETDGAGNLAALNAWLASNGGAAATDVGSAVTWSNNFASVSDGCGKTGSATVTFTATDACGNASTTTATFTIVDTVRPVFGAQAANKVVETDGAGNLAALSSWLASHAGATATDVGGAVTWTHSYTATSMSDGCGATGVASVTFTATDECGLTSTTSATFTIVDTTKPVLSSNVRNISPNEKPVTFTVSSADIGGTATPTITSVTATRVNGADKTKDKTDPYKHSVSGNKVTIETSGGVDTVWTISASAVDECGNVATATFIVNVVNPTLTK